MEHTDDNSEFVKIGEVAKYFGVTTQCIREWEKSGRITSKRTAKGTRLFKLSEYQSEEASEPVRYKVFYCRVSSVKQRGDLDRQISLAREKYPEHEIVSDIGSGLNWKRPGLRRILARSSKGEIQEVIVFHRDRLCRFGFEIIEYAFSLNKTRLVVHEQDEYKSRADELSEDLMAITHVFSCSYYGSRKYKSKEGEVSAKQDPEEDSQDVD